MAFRYLTLEDAIETHKVTVAVSGGGSHGHLNISQLGSVLHHIQNDVLYPTLALKLTHLFFCANKFHCFEDGNKRIAISLCAQMLLINGHAFIKEFCVQMENISYHVASGAIDKELLQDIFVAMLDGDLESDEGLKLRIVIAIQDGSSSPERNARAGPPTSEEGGNISNP